METSNHLILSTFPLSKTARKPRGTTSATGSSSYFMGEKGFAFGELLTIKFSGEKVK